MTIKSINDASGWTRGWCDDDDIDVYTDDEMFYVATVRGCRREDTDGGEKTRTNDYGCGYRGRTRGRCTDVV